MLRDDRAGGEGRWQAARNVLGEALEICSMFLEFSKSRGNDLSTPQPEFGFPGLKPGDRWCLCAPRWQEAFEAKQAPRVVLRATLHVQTCIAALNLPLRKASPLRSLWSSRISSKWWCAMPSTTSEYMVMKRR